jgi:DNA-binding NarL/FixJ family response regulator
VDKIRILVVDDHTEVLKQVRTRLSYEEDFLVCLIAPVSKITESLMKSKPDILLIDPYVDNNLRLDCIRLAKKILPKIKVIVLTAVVDTAANVELRKAGAEVILEKGITSEELVNTIRSQFVKEPEK